MSVAKKTDAARMLEALSDGRRWSTAELYALNLTPHSRKSTLVHDFGYAIDVTREDSPVGEKAVYFYRLVAVPLEPSPLERMIEQDAAARLAAMRSHHKLASTVSPGSGPEQAIDARSEGSQTPLPSVPAADGPLAPAAGTLSSRASWIADLTEELRGVEDEISNLRSQLFLSDEDSKRLDVLLDRARSISERLELLGRRAAA